MFFFLYAEHCVLTAGSAIFRNYAQTIINTGSREKIRRKYGASFALHTKLKQQVTWSACAEQYAQLVNGLAFNTKSFSGFLFEGR